MVRKETGAHFSESPMWTNTLLLEPLFPAAALAAIFFGTGHSPGVTISPAAFYYLNTSGFYHSLPTLN